MTTALRSRWSDAARPGGRLRRYAPLAALGLVLVVLSVLFARTPSTGLPLDPASVDPTGTKALALILDRAGADVEVLDDVTAPGVDTLLIAVDNLDEAAADDVRRFVEAGGRVLVADPGGGLTPTRRPAGTAGAGFVQPTLRRDCDEPALAGIERIAPGSAPLFVVPAGATGCFAREDAAWLILEPVGSGTLISAGSPDFLTNYLIGEQDNAALAVALLAPRPGTRVGILTPAFAPAGGGVTLTDLLPTGLTVAALQLVVAFAVVVAWRSRRLGKPVREPQAVQLAGSELVVAVGNLYQRTGARARAAVLLRADFRTDLAHRLGVPHDLPAEDVADVAAARTGASRDAVLDALAGPAPQSDADLVALAQRLESVRSAVASAALTSTT